MLPIREYPRSVSPNVRYLCAAINRHRIGMYDKIASYEDWSYPANLTIWDTASAAEYDVMRPLAYQDAHAIIICFSTVDPDSYYSVASKWWPEVYNKAYGVPIILVGTKIDVRMNTPVERPRISYEQGQQLASDIGASEFAECSALTHEGRDYIFYRAVE